MLWNNKDSRIYFLSGTLDFLVVKFSVPLFFIYFMFGQYNTKIIDLFSTKLIVGLYQQAVDLNSTDWFIKSFSSVGGTFESRIFPFVWFCCLNFIDVGQCERPNASLDTWFYQKVVFEKRSQ